MTISTSLRFCPALAVTPRGHAPCDLPAKSGPKRETIQSLASLRLSLRVGLSAGLLGLALEYY